MATPIITVTPAPDAVGVPIGSSISIIFDTEIDVGSILAGNIVITGVIDQIYAGPDSIIYDRITSDLLSPYLLSMPSFMGPIQYDITIKRVDSNGDEVSTLDDGTNLNSGELYYSKVILSPKQALKPNVKYGVVISTDITKNTVFDSVYVSDPGSSGKVVFTGPYTGAVNDQFIVQITGGTTYLDLTFDWWKASNPGSVTSVNTANKRSVYLTDGVTVNFDTGTFLTGDQISVNVVPQDNLESLYNWSFITANSLLVTPNSISSTEITNVDFIDGIGSSLPSTVSGEEAFISSSPTADSYQNTPTGEIVICYSDNIVVASLNSSKIRVVTERLLSSDIFCESTPIQEVVVPTISIDDNCVTLSGITMSTNSVVTVEISKGFITLENGNVAKKETFDFMTAFDKFFTTPSYVKFRGGGTLDVVPDVLIAEKIGIISTELWDLFSRCFTTMCSVSPDIKKYFSTIVRQYVTDKLLLEIMENSGNLVPMSKSIDSFKVSFGNAGAGRTSGKAGPLYDALKKNVKDNLVAIRSCMKLGPGMRSVPGVFEKSSTSVFPGLRGRDMYTGRSSIPGLNSTIEFENYRIRSWSDTLSNE